MSIFIIAEIGVNHNGDIRLAEKLIDAAAEAGCDAVKFQTFKANKLVVEKAEKADYQKETTGSAETQYQMLKKLELNEKQHIQLFKYCKNSGIEFMSTPFDEESADFLEELGMARFKIPSGEITNKPFICHIVKKNKPMIMSTGMSTFEEVEEAVGWVNETNPSAELSILHCTTAYPAKMEDVNLLAIKTLRDNLHLKVGYSDHTAGIEIPIAAAALGAGIIEKHFTLDRGLEGPDHKASLEPKELKEMVRCIRNVEKALGNGVKTVAEGEAGNLGIARRSIVAARDIKKGEILSSSMVTLKRPGTGISPKYIEKIIGKKCDREYKKDDLIVPCKDWAL